MERNEDVDLGLHDKTGALLMLNKGERELLKELLLMTMSSERVKDLITKRLGSNYIEIGEKLLKSIGGS